MLVRLPQLDVTRLAADYSAAVRDAHTRAQLETIRERNAREHDPEIDHVHDFTDVSDLLADCVRLQLGAVDDWSGIADDMNTAQRRAKAAGYRLSRILVACEWSGTLRDELTARGHSAISADLLPTASAGPHYQGDVRDIMNDGYHMMIAFPPCTYLANSGAKHLVRGGKRIDPERWQKMREGAEFFNDLGSADVPQICRENPIMHKHARAIIQRRADQYVQPYQFGHDASKATGLYLDELPPLETDPADYVPPRRIKYREKWVNRWANQSPCGAERQGPSADRGHKRGKTFAGIARAMAEQWTGITKRLTAPASQPAQLALF